MHYDASALETLKSLDVVRQIAEQQGRLVGKEVRLLRRHMGWCGRELAEKIGCRVEDIARCEWDIASLEPERERFLRSHFLPVGGRWKTVIEPDI